VAKLWGEDLTGQTFRKLTVLGRSERKRGRNRETLWRCLCVCGKECVKRSHLLRYGEANSCGCDRNFGHNRAATRELAIKRATYGKTLKSASWRQIAFSLTLNEYWDIVRRPCHYCGRSGVAVSRDGPDRKGGRLSNEAIRHNGLDRIDSGGGYTTDNVVSCCKDCNFAKNGMTTDEFRQWIRMVYEHFGKAWTL
jgi:hypothetical protein